MRVLGIETSCDETAAALVTRDGTGNPQILSNIVLSQIAEHAEYGGVVPEIAARAHLSALTGIIDRAMETAGSGLREIDGIAVTAGPGLVGGLLVGLMTAKALAASLDKPLIAVNHLEGHALTARLTHNLDFPYLLLLVSGGHTQILEVNGLADYHRLATTIDDALGEAFDKTAKLLGLPFPGGPSVEKAAFGGDPMRFAFPRPMKGQARLDFSLSGLKTAVRVEAERLAPVDETDVCDLCASFQQAICDMLEDRVSRAVRQFAARTGHPTLVVAGGVAANARIREVLQAACRQNDCGFIAPPPELCGDNAAIIAWAGLMRLEAGYRSQLDFPPHPRWPLDDGAARAIGYGRRGIKV